LAPFSAKAVCGHEGQKHRKVSESAMSFLIAKLARTMPTIINKIGIRILKKPKILAVLITNQ
jgi:hypothetical protein